jgi:ribosomal protein L15
MFCLCIQPVWPDLRRAGRGGRKRGRGKEEGGGRGKGSNTFGLALTLIRATFHAGMETLLMVYAMNLTEWAN